MKLFTLVGDELAVLRLEENQFVHDLADLVLHAIAVQSHHHELGHDLFTGFEDPGLELVFVSLAKVDLLPGGLLNRLGFGF